MNLIAGVQLFRGLKQGLQLTQLFAQFTDLLIKKGGLFFRLQQILRALIKRCCFFRQLLFRVLQQNLAFH